MAPLEGNQVKKLIKVLSKKVHGMEGSKARLVSKLTAKKDPKCLFFLGESQTGNFQKWVGEALADGLDREFRELTLNAVMEKCETDNPVVFVGNSAVDEFNEDSIRQMVLKVIGEEKDPLVIVEVNEGDNIEYEENMIIRVCPTISYSDYPPWIDICREHIIPALCDEYDLKEKQIKISDRVLYFLFDQTSLQHKEQSLFYTLRHLIESAVVTMKVKKRKTYTISETDVVRMMNHLKNPIDYTWHTAWDVEGDQRPYGECPTICCSRDGNLKPGLVEVTSLPAGIADQTEIHGTNIISPALRAINAVKVLAHRNSGVEFFKENSVLIDVPEDMKDYGLPLALAIVSRMALRPVPSDFAVFGDLSASGRINPIQLIQEIYACCQRLGIKNMVIPSQNMLDIEALDEKDPKINVIPADHFSDVVNIVLFPEELEKKKENAKLFEAEGEQQEDTQEATAEQSVEMKEEEQESIPNSEPIQPEEEEVVWESSPQESIPQHQEEETQEVVASQQS